MKIKTNKMRNIHVNNPLMKKDCSHIVHTKFNKSQRSNKKVLIKKELE